jgi:hypothetical protein
VADAEVIEIGNEVGTGWGKPGAVGGELGVGVSSEVEVRAIGLGGESDIGDFFRKIVCVLHSMRQELLQSEPFFKLHIRSYENFVSLPDLFRRVFGFLFLD